MSGKVRRKGELARTKLRSYRANSWHGEHALRLIYVLAATAALSLSSAAFAQTPDQPNGSPAGTGSNPPGGEVQGGTQMGGGTAPQEGSAGRMHRHMMHHHMMHHHHMMMRHHHMMMHHHHMQKQM